jgi:hypothetical protein
MRTFLRILSLLTLYLLLTAKSCNTREQISAEKEAERIAAENDSLRSVLGSDTLGVNFLKAMEGSAKLKLADFFDYLQVLDDTSANAVFKEKSAEMIRNLFLQNKIPGTITPLGFQFVPGSVRITDPFQRTNDTLYSGKLIFTIKSAVNSTQPQPTGPGKEMSAKIFLVKQQKIFAGTSSKVWTVLLGEFR